MDTKLQKYAEIQPLVQKDANDIAVKVYNELGTEFGVAKVPYHEHNGIDSPNIPFTNIANNQSYRVVRYFTLSSAQILALKSQAVTIIPPYPLKSFVIVEGITARLSFVSPGGVAYTGAGNLEFRYTDGSGTKVTADIPNTFINSSSTSYYYAPAVTTAFVPLAGTPVVVRVNGTDPLNGNGTITLVITYRVIQFNN